MATNGDSRVSVFARYIDSPEQEPTPASTPLAAGRLLGWIQNNWKKPTITTRNICQYGPRPIRDRESAIRTAEVLVRHGWLTPMKMGRHDAKGWRIAIGD